ncbi:hypothetical protein SDC9_127226 [bioreactor metagenome]|uniref:Uncharacterized protein n=1 Tax=bioreactor metagenome TaxID=1076179 RepID=A0A645CTG1_9ZZZZ
MVQDTVAHLPGQVEAALAFKHLNHAQALLVMAKAAADQAVHCTLPDMSKWRMAQIMPQGNRLRQILIEPQPPGNAARHLGDFKRMRQAGTVMVPLRRNKYLRFELKAAKALGMNNAVSVTLELAAQLAGLDRLISPPALRALGGQGGQFLHLPALNHFLDVHPMPPNR